MHRIIETQFRDILARQVETAAALWDGLAESGTLNAGKAERQALAGNTIMIASYWLSCPPALSERLSQAYLDTEGEEDASQAAEMEKLSR